MSDVPSWRGLGLSALVAGAFFLNPLAGLVLLGVILFFGFAQRQNEVTQLLARTPADYPDGEELSYAEQRREDLGLPHHAGEDRWYTTEAEAGESRWLPLSPGQRNRRGYYRDCQSWRLPPYPLPGDRPHLTA